MKILICASEVVPFAKTGGLADVAGALPIALEELGHQLIISLPYYQSIQSSKFKIQKLKDDIYYTNIGRDIKVYFIRNDKYFARPGLYGEKTGDYPDNLERFSFYCNRSLELLKEINFKPHIIHVHDWQAALIPVYLKTTYADDPFYKKTRSVLTIHNIGYQGLFEREQFPKLGLDWALFNMEALEFYGKVNLLKGGIVFSDIINTVSPTYAKEIQTKEFGFGLEGILRKRSDSVFGILNGLDYAIWNPQTDKFIVKNYSIANIEEKYENKKELQKICNLPIGIDIPVFGIVSRLAEQKGFDLLSEAIDSICRLNLQLVILGTGDFKYHLLLEKISKRKPHIISLHLRFDDSLAHKIYAGSDIFLMPSKYEPCGLGQMISLRYGTIPLVFKTGGLADTITDDNGFVFDRYTKLDLLKTIEKSFKAFQDKKNWQDLVRRAMSYNFSWEESAKRYTQLYQKVLDR
ncbi:MAG: glycogen synthase GlgA [Candidatus Omnitrophica bacterium]|nr:glycogen synthase GlgA [Candidatus Omnitrophota bacterium]